ncbi:MAG: hypothetical protein HYW69_03320 [Candidatus Nealsonbacteria bacterium]|nr:hypothetical protein [Candidatus Nealsonbacteria bacterium]
MPALRLSLIYGFRPNALGLCGPQEEKNKKIISDFIGGKDIPEKTMRAIIENFRGAYPYYQMVASASKIKDPLSERAVRAYWTGSSDLEKARFADFEKMAKDRFFLKKIPAGSLPHHSFHVLNVGRINGKLREDLLDVCLVKWGRVKKIFGSEVSVDNYEELKKRKNTFYFAPKSVKEVAWDKKLVQNLKIGDWVSIHWRNVIEKLNKESVRNLKKYTKINLRAYGSGFREKTNK